MLNISIIHNRKNSTAASLVQIRVYFPDTRKYVFFSTGVKITSDFWKDNRVSQRHQFANRLNATIDGMMSRLRKEELSLQANGITPTPALIRAVFDGQQEIATNLKEFYASEKELQKISQATAIHENRSITTFTELFGNIGMAAITLEHLQQFEKHLQAQGFALDTRYNYHKHLRKYLYRAKDKELSKRVPYVQFKMKRSSESTKQWLTAQEHEKIEKAEVHTKSMARVKERFLFCCYTGLSFMDATTLSSDNITEMLGARWIVMDRHKTGRTFRVPLIAKAEAILNQKPVTGPYFKSITNQVFNHYLKDLAAIASIDKLLTSHVARHTFATTIALENGITLETLSAMMGTTIKTAQWYGRIVDARILGEMGKLM
jgi:site-specific recombinase XerD